MKDIPRKIEKLKRQDQQKLDQIVVHTCCADCFLNALNYLVRQDIIDGNTRIISLYYNPNIHPRSEYYARLEALKKVISEKKEFNVKLVIPDYRPIEYMDAVLNKEKEGGRCNICWKLRLGSLFKFAIENGIKNVTSTLLTSHYQDKGVIMEIARELNSEEDLNFIDINESCNCKNVGFYKQNYCGCCFSLTEKLVSR